MFVGFELA